MKSDFALALNKIVSERNLPKEMIAQVMAQALTATYKKNNPNLLTSQNAEIKVDIDEGEIQILVEKEVVEDIFDARTEILLAVAQKQDPNIQLGDMLMADVTETEFSKIAAQNAKQQIVQKLREAERDFQFNSYAEQEGAIVLGVVQSVNLSGMVVGLGKVEGILNRKECLPGEVFDVQQKVRAYVSEVRKSPRGMQIVLSRTHKGMLRRLLELEVPEIQSEKIEIRSISREPGFRSKVAVVAKEASLDAVGACIGQRGARIQNIVNELRGEKIDVIEYSEDPAAYLTKALGPAKVLAVFPVIAQGAYDRETRQATVIVPDDQLSLAIGREGQNARLAAKLTGWRIDIKSGSEAVTEAVAKINEHDSLRITVDAETLTQLPSLRDTLVRQRTVATALNNDEFALAKKVLETVRAFETKNGIIRLSTPTTLPPAAPKPVRPPPPPPGTAVIKPNFAELEHNPAVPEAAYNMPLALLGLSVKTEQHLISVGLRNVGQVMTVRLHGEETLLGIEGMSQKAVSDVKTALDRQMALFMTPVLPKIKPEPVSKPEKAAPKQKPETVAKEELVTHQVIDEPILKPLAEGEVDVDFEDFANYDFEDEDEDDDRDAASMRRSGSSPAGPAKKGKAKGKDRKGRPLVFDEDTGRTTVAKPGADPIVP